MSRPLSAAIQELYDLEDTGDAQGASALRTKIVDAGYGDQLRVANKPQMMPDEPSFLDNWGRVIAEGGGALVGGAGGLVMGGGPTAGVGAIPGMMAGSALGGELAGRGYDYITDATGGQAPERSVQDMASSALFNSMGGPTPARAVGPSMLRGLTGQGVAASDDGVRTAAREMDIPFLTRGQLGNKTSQALEGALEGTFSGTKVINQQKDELMSGFGRYIDEAWPAPGTRAGVGDVLTRGAEDAATNLRGTQGGLYDTIDTVLASAGHSSSSRISVPEGYKLLKEIRSRAARDADFASLVNTDPQVMKFVNAVEEASNGGFNAVSYDTLKQFRTNVGEQMDSLFATATNGGSQSQKKHLYGVLSKDIAGGAEQLAGKPGRQAGSRANWYTRAMSARLEKIHPIFKNADNPTKVYEALGRSAYSDPGTLTAVRKTLPTEAWDEFTTKFIRGLLEPRPGNTERLSFQTIVTNLNKLKRSSPEGYAEIFSGSEQAVENVLRLSHRLKESEKYINHSRSGNVRSLLGVTEAMAVGGSAVLTGGDPVKIGASVLGTAAIQTLIPKLLAHAVTSPTLALAISKLPTNVLNLKNAADLSRALIAAGADEKEVTEMFESEGRLGSK